MAAGRPHGRTVGRNRMIEAGSARGGRHRDRLAPDVRFRYIVTARGSATEILTGLRPADDAAWRRLKTRRREDADAPWLEPAVVVGWSRSARVGPAARNRRVGVRRGRAAPPRARRGRRG